MPSRCIKLYTFENEVVLDPFIGSGTTAVAALMLKRKFVGYEIDQKYIEIANKRIDVVRNQSTLVTKHEALKQETASLE